jgi:hypothetical protein
MPKTATKAAAIEQPEVMFALEMREKMRGPWRPHAGTWLSTTEWTIDLTREQYATCLAVLPRQKARKVVSHA